ncbi:MAG: formylglycine-generating enzyme family protein, partial [bacterium]|nr:formylglycine-generating enzyme family protein [bacterium]
AGTRTMYFFGDDAKLIDEYAWMDVLDLSEVGKKKPNAWGLHDMYGNILEWCWDWDWDYAHADVTDPRGPDTGYGRVQRGNHYGRSGKGYTTASVEADTPLNSDAFRGFRVVCEPGAVAVAASSVPAPSASAPSLARQEGKNEVLLIALIAGGVTVGVYLLERRRRRAAAAAQETHSDPVA